MKTQTIYVAEDGSRFNDKQKCIDYEELCHKVETIMFFLDSPEESSGCNFENGGGFIQHDIDLLQGVKRDFFNLCAEVIPDFAQWFTEVSDGQRHISYVSRILDDYDIKCLRYANYRLSCTSFDTGREYGQPYFALNPDKAKDIQLN